MSPVLLLAEREQHLEALARNLHAMPDLRVIALPAWDRRKIAQPGFDLVVACFGCEMAGRCIPELRELQPAAKLLALTPFSGMFSETDLVGLGADDVLRLPVTSGRLAVTIRNLLKTGALERRLRESMIA